MNLRERRKHDTTELIRRSALELATGLEVDAISVEAICQKAGISQRTFFNYFPFKEAAFVVPPPPFPKTAVDTFLSGEGPLLDLVVDLLAAQALTLSPNRDMIDISRRIAEKHPKITALQFGAFREFESSLATLIGARAGTALSNMDCRVVASAILGALRVVFDEYGGGSRKQVARAIARDLRGLSALTLVMSPPKKKPERVGR